MVQNLHVRGTGEEGFAIWQPGRCRVERSGLDQGILKPSDRPFVTGLPLPGIDLSIQHGLEESRRLCDPTSNKVASTDSSAALPLFVLLPESSSCITGRRP
jgi:hypothetical protein